jgi:hypothetical protein
MIVTPGYFTALDISLKDGRLFSNQDRAGRLPVALVNETMSRQFWPGESPTGRRIKHGIRRAPSPWLTVVGVIRDVKDVDLSAEAKPAIYLPYRQNPVPGMTIVVRTAGDPKQAESIIRSAVLAVDPEQAITAVRTLDEVRWDSLASQRAAVLWVGGFALIAVVLAAAGVFGVVSFAVAQRRPEFGIRMALGASPGDLEWISVRQGMTWVLSGILIGLCTPILLAKLWATQFGAPVVLDALTYACATCLLGGVALIACYLPARQVAALDPIEQLRFD